MPRADRDLGQGRRACSSASRRPYAEIFKTIYNGKIEKEGNRWKMPAWRGKLSKEQIWALIYFVEYQSGGIEGRFPPSLIRARTRSRSGKVSVARPVAYATGVRALIVTAVSFSDRRGNVLAVGLIVRAREQSQSARWSSRPALTATMSAMPLANRNSENEVDHGVNLSVSIPLGAGVARRSTWPGSVSADSLPVAVEPQRNEPPAKQRGSIRFAAGA